MVNKLQKTKTEIVRIKKIIVKELCKITPYLIREEEGVPVKD